MGSEINPLKAKAVASCVSGLSWLIAEWVLVRARRQHSPHRSSDMKFYSLAFTSAANGIGQAAIGKDAFAAVHRVSC